jgi:hypothetical protein
MWIVLVVNANLCLLIYIGHHPSFEALQKDTRLAVLGAKETVSPVSCTLQK